MAVITVEEIDILPAEEGSIGKVKIVQEGIGEIKNNKIIVRNSKIAEVNFTKLNAQNQPKNDFL